MFESSKRLHEDVNGLLGALRSLAEGRYAALFDAKGVLMESPAGGSEGEWALRRFIETRGSALFRIPAALRGDERMEDVFEEWHADEFFLAFVNGKVGVLVACPDATTRRVRVGEAAEGAGRPAAAPEPGLAPRRARPRALRRPAEAGDRRDRAARPVGRLDRLTG